jgi:hypothetical protein
MYQYGGERARLSMVLAALFRLQSSSCETECNFVCNCMYISMSYQYCMYEFVGPNPAGLRGEDARCRSVSSSSLSVCFTGIFRGHVGTCLKRFPSKHTDRLQSPVPNSICPGWMLRAGPRAAARARTSGI